jgi:signal transduction histidine kinase
VIMKLQGRFFLSHALAAALTLAACLGLSHRAARLSFRAEESRRQAQMLSDFSQTARDAGFRREDLGLVQAMRSLLANRSVVFAAYYNPATQLNVAVPPAFAGEAWRVSSTAAGAPRERTLRNKVGVIDWRAPLDPKDRKSAWVEIAFSAEDGQRVLDLQMRDWDRHLAWILAAGLALAALLGAVMARNLVRPLLRINDGTQLVRSGRLDHLVEVERGDEIGDLARSFNSMVLQLKELDEMKRDFVAGVTHDFGSPLHAIRTTIVHLLSGKAGPVGPRHAEYLLMISNNLDTLTAFVNNLLTVARIEAAKMEPHFQPLDAGSQVSDLMKLFEAQAQEKGLEWVLNRNSKNLAVVADMTMFRQIVMNLLSNALKFTDHGKVEVALSETAGDLVLEVEDTGLGIAPAHHQLIFDKFFRVHQNTDAPLRQGSGLGLAIAKGLVELHGGAIGLESSLGHGARFTVRLPKQPNLPIPPSPGAAAG